MIRLFVALYAALCASLLLAIFLAVVAAIVIGITNLNHTYLHWSLAHLLMALAGLTFLGLVVIADRMRLDD